MSIKIRARRGFATAIAAVLATGGVVALASAPAEAADKTVNGVSLTWSLSNEQGGGAYFGGCNFLSAGTAGDSGSSRLWTEADGFYKTVDGNVSIEKPDASGAFVAPTWATKCKTPAGTDVNAGSTSSFTGNRVKLSAGAGTIDTATGAGTISWTGSFTSAFYGGLTYWSASNPKLTINADGTGTLTATGTGYGASMDDTSQWGALAPRTITLANFTAADFNDDGLTATPTYRGTTVNVTTGTPQPAKTSANEAFWGSFPQSFVDFQVETGQSSYWYTSGGSRDVAKPATPVAVSIPNPKVTVAKTSFLPNGTQAVTVTGSGFEPSLAIGTRPPFSGKPSGVYIAFGRYADNWRPSQPNSGGRNNPSGANGNGAGIKWAVPLATLASSGFEPTGAYAELKTDGTFSTTIQVDQSWLSSVSGNFGIYTYAGGGPNVAAYETATPITFDQASSTITAGPISSPHKVGTALSTEVTVAGRDITPTGTVAAYNGTTKLDEQTLANGKATFDLGDLALGSYSITFKYQGDANYLESTSAAQPLEVVKFISATTATALASPIKIGATASTEVTVAGDGPTATGKVTAYDGETKLDEQDLADGKATFNLADFAAGTHSITFRYAGDDSYGASSSPAQSVDVEKFDSAVTADAIATPIKVGVSASTEVTVAGDGPTATGTVTAFDGETKLDEKDLADGKATFALADLAVGTHSITFKYAGDANYLESDSAAQALTVTKNSSKPTVSVPSSKIYGKTATVTATVPTVNGIAPTGNLVLAGAGTAQTKKLSGGKATFTVPANLAVGKRVLTVKYSGDVNYDTSNAVASITVKKDTVSITDKVTKKPTTKKSGKVKITVKAKASSVKPSGNVTVYFKMKGQKTVKTSAGTLKNGVKTLSVKKLNKKGTWKIYVKYSAGSGYSSVSPKYVGTVKVTK